MKDYFTISSNALPETTRVAGFRGTEGISRPYEFELYLLAGAEGQDVDLGDAIGVKAKLEIDRHDGRPPFVFHGIFVAFELLHELGEQSLFHATLVPQIWQLTQTLHSRVFTNQTIPDIIRDVLEDGGLSGDDYVFKLAGQYRIEEHVCQYQESNFDFISRWMEREGMYYYFEQGDASERLVITDHRSFQGALVDRAVRFHAHSGHDVSAGEALHAFTCKHRALPAGVRLKDYNYAKPTLDVSGGAPVSKVGMGEISVHGARFFTPDEGNHLARIRAEELLARQVVYRGSGTALYLRSGYFFKLEQHPRAGFDAEYLVTDVDHQGNQAISSPELRALTGIEEDRVYWVDVKAVPAQVQFRPASSTAWPRIYGSERHHLRPGGERVRAARRGGALQRQVQVRRERPQGRQGVDLGAHAPAARRRHRGLALPLRKGTEVIFTFLGGDPDRPVIAGTVPNLHTPSPVTRANHTTNVIQTGGRNRLEMEDRAGYERITLQTPHANTMLRMGAPNDDHTLILRTDGKAGLAVGSNYDVTVGGSKAELVFGAKASVFIGATTSMTIGAKAELNLSARASWSEGRTTRAAAKSTKITR